MLTRPPSRRAAFNLAESRVRVRIVARREQAEDKVQDFVQAAYDHHEGENLAESPCPFAWLNDRVALGLMIAGIRWRRTLTKKSGHAKSSAVTTEYTAGLHRTREVGTRNIQ